MDFWEMHRKITDTTCDCYSPQCDACAMELAVCNECGQGYVHTHFDEDLERIEARCDHCARLGLPVGEEEMEIENAHVD
jgi:hypothetical protein